MQSKTNAVNAIAGAKKEEEASHRLQGKDSRLHLDPMHCDSKSIIGFAVFKLAEQSSSSRCG